MIRGIAPAREHHRKQGCTSLCGIRPNKAIRPAAACPIITDRIYISGPPKGPAERGPQVKKRQKSSKSVKNIFDTFRHFSRRAKNVNIRQKVSKIISTLFDDFRAAPVFRPLLGGSDYIRLPPAPHISGQKAFFRGGEWGCAAGIL